MHDRIRELAEQAEYSINEVFVWDPTGPDREDVIREKFAELIVRECISIVDKYGDSDEGNHIAYQIEKHFGVEV